MNARLFLRTLGCGLLLLAAGSLRAQSDIDSSLRSGGLDRTYKLHLPANLPSGAPLVVVLHGYGGLGLPERYGLNPTADRHGFAVCYPQGEKDAKGKTCWNVGYPFQAGLQTDDVQFLADLVRHLQRQHRLSHRNVFCCGMSNGGEMCYQLAVQRPRLFAAVAPVSGLMLDWLYRADRSRVPVPLFEIHGTEDTTSAWAGDPENKGGWGAYMPVPTAVQHWADKARCSLSECDTIPGKTPANGRRIVRHRFTGGKSGCEVWLYEVIGGKHSWGNQDLDTGEELWRFFSKYLR